MHNNCPRYLIFFQYIGTKYSWMFQLRFHFKTRFCTKLCDPSIEMARGVVNGPPQQPEVRGVQDYLEDALRKMKPVTPPRVYVSSRTDAGVHALSNSAHLDLQRRDSKPPFSEDVLVAALNHHLKPEDIRVTHVHRVAGDFHARFNALSRTYVYRLAQGVPHASLFPLSERRLCWALCKYTELDVGAMQEAAAMLIGTHDFSSFMAINSDTPFKNPVKTLDVARVDPGTSFAGAHFYREVPFWELTFRSRSFLYRQVRRMTGALVAVGQGQLTQDQFRQILEDADSLGFPKNMSAPPWGLYLTRVEYSLTDLQFTPHSSEGVSSSTGNQEG